MKRRIFTVLFLTAFAVTLGMGIIMPFMPTYAQSLGATGVWLGIFFSSFSLARVVFTPAIGSTSDRIGRKLLISLGLFAFTLFSLGYAWAGNAPELALVRFLHGISSAMVLPIALAYIGEISPEGREGNYVGAFYISLFAGTGFGPLLGGLLSEHFGITHTFYVMGGLSLIALILILFFLPERSEQLRREFDKKITITFKEMLQNNTLRGLIVFGTTLALGRAVALSFLPLYGASLNLNSSEIGMLLSANLALMASLTWFAGKLADRYDRTTLVSVGSLLISISLSLIIYAGSFLELLAINVVMGIVTAIASQAANALYTTLGRDYGTGSMMGISDSATSAGMIAGPLIAGYLMDALGLASIFYFCCAASFVGAGLFYLFARNDVSSK